MGNARTSVVAALSVSCVYLVYVHIYCSYKLLKANVLNERLPSFVFLYIKYVTRALTRRTGYLHTATTRERDVVYTALNCRWAGSTSVESFKDTKLSKTGHPHLESVYLSSKGWTLPCCGGSAVLQVMVGIIQTRNTETSRCASRRLSAADCCSWCWLMHTSDSARQVRHDTHSAGLLEQTIQRVKADCSILCLIN